MLHVCALCSYSMHAIEMDDRVTKVFERAIIILSRREDPTDNKYYFIPHFLVTLLMYDEQQ